MSFLFPKPQQAKPAPQARMADASTLPGTAATSTTGPGPGSLVSTGTAGLQRKPKTQRTSLIGG